MALAGLCLFLDVAIELKRFGIFFAHIREGLLFSFNPTILNIGMVAVKIKVTAICESELLSVPGARMQMAVAICMVLLADGSLEELTSGGLAGLLLQQCQESLTALWALAVSEKD